MCAVIAAVLFGWVRPAGRARRRAAFALAGLAVLALAVFWSGLPVVLGMGAIHAGARADARVPMAVGAVAVVLALVGSAVGYMAGSTSSRPR